MSETFYPTISEDDEPLEEKPRDDFLTTPPEEEFSAPVNPQAIEEARSFTSAPINPQDIRVQQRRDFLAGDERHRSWADL